MDTNVHLNNTLLVVDALIQTNKISISSCFRIARYLLVPELPQYEFAAAGAVTAACAGTSARATKTSVYRKRA